MDIENNIEQLILRKFDGSLSGEENNSLQNWLSYPANKMVYRQYSQIWQLSSSLRNWEEFDSRKAFQNVKKEVYKAPSNFISKPWMRVAAMAMILIAAGIGVYMFIPGLFNGHSSIMVDNNRLFLEDGTEIVLARNAEIETFGSYGDERRIRLRGEAFFNVTHDETKPFIIEMGETEIEVVGTSFLANSEKNSVFVRDGKVLLKDSNNPDNHVTLIAGEKASMKAEKLSKRDFEIDWLKEDMALKDRQVRELLTELVNLFPQSLTVDIERVAEDCKITSSFNGISLKDVIEELDLLFALKYEILPNKIHVYSLDCE